MEIIFKGKNLELTPALKGYAEKKVGKIQKFFEKAIVGANVVFSVEKGLHTVDITVQVDGLLLKGEETTGDMYASIDGAVDSIERQIRKYKTRINRKLRQLGTKLVESALNEANEQGEAEEPRIVKTKRFAIKPMSVEEAVMQMDLLGHDFFVFSNAETEEVNVVYRRRDGNYGLIEPEF
ncbi:MAG TPA: ribosome-associated translation inhibitor RaiA [Firmicutes bacterium]|nr:ribosome-associated translation inhibitor RaiA [Bacillota bacterium]HHY98068.1 ribosome-associated translation inhibitor RaiA [Bacillota bacterium]